MVQLQSGLHAVVVLELDECKAAAFGRLVLLCRDAHCSGRNLLKVFRDGLGVGGVGEISYHSRLSHFRRGIDDG